MSVALAITLIASATASFANEKDSYRYGVSGNNVVFSTPKQALKGGSFQLAVKNGKPGKISVELVDIFSNASGSRKSIPLNSSPFTPSGLVVLKENYPAYQPSEDFQYFEISFRFRDDVALDRPVLGGVSISIVPDEAPDSQATVESSIVATFAYLPKEGLDLQLYSPALELQGPTIGRKTPDFFPLNLLPNLPFVLNHGDVNLGYELTNTGKIFLETTTLLSIQQVGLFFQADKEIFSQTKTAFLVPEQQAAEAIEIAPLDTENKLLGIGLYRFQLTSTGQIGDFLETSTANQQMLIIFPWKQSFLAILLLVLLRRQLAKAFNWLLGYAKALRDFRYGKDPTPTLTPVLTPTPNLTITPANNQTTDPRPEINPTQQVAMPKPTVKPPGATNAASPVSPMPETREPRALYPFWYQPPKNRQ